MLNTTEIMAIGLPVVLLLLLIVLCLLILYNEYHISQKKLKYGGKIKDEGRKHKLTLILIQL